jgi:hypothetical protein
MKNMLDKLYNVVLNEKSYAFSDQDTEDIKKETTAYEELYDNLSEPLQKQFLRYLKFRDNDEKEEVAHAYKKGFQDAISLIMEALQSE